MEDMDHLDRQSMLTCPDCNGVMWEIDEASSSAFAATSVMLPPSVG